MLRLSAPTEALDDQDGATAPIGDALVARAAAEEPEHCADGHAADRAAQVMIPRQQVPQPMRQAQHPLTHWHIGPDVIDQMRSSLRHAAATTARAEPAALAREGDESIETAGRAAKAREAAGQTAAAEEVAKLLLHEAREALAVAQRRRFRAEGLEMVSDDSVQDGGRGIARRVGGRWRRYAANEGVGRATLRDQ